MDGLLLSRAQFAVTTIYHFFFVPLTLGLSILVAIMQTMYARGGDERHKRMTQFWGKLFVINFAMGVVTGIVQEFGLNWSEYSRFVGDVFGAPLAIEALLAFFLESTFLGLWIFGWNRLSRPLHAATIWLVAIGSTLSAMWILVANSFMQQPVGYTLRNGRAEMTDFFALITNPNVLTQYPHVLLAGVATAGFFVMGISAYHLLREDSDHAVFGTSFRLAAIYALVGAALVIPVGHAQTQHLIQTQPMKMAAAEALWNSEDPAALSLFTYGDEANRRDIFAIRVSPVLSLLAYGTTTGEVQGINQLQAQYEKTYGPGDYVPPVAVSYWSFRAMVGAGFAMLLLAFLGLVYIWRGRLPGQKWLLRILVLSIALPYLANSTGWMLTELGRQPWIVFGLMRTADASSPSVPTLWVAISLIGFTLLYGALMVADVYLLVKFARSQPSATADSELAEAY
ncbi:MAG: cytochrome ubiquinol oxidase subunit I [Chloroflexota bacterium]